MPKIGNYLKLALALFAGGLIAAVVVNYWVDPYDIYHSGSRWGIKSHPAIEEQDRLHKPYAISRMKPRSLLLGNSRVELGLDPENNLLPQPAYNGSYSGGTVFEALQTYRFAESREHIELVVMDLDPHMLFDPVLFQDGFNAERLVPRLAGNWNPSITAHDFVITLASVGACYDSLRALLLSRGVPVQYKNGLRDVGLLMRDHPAERQRKRNGELMRREDWKGFTSENKRQMDALGALVRTCSDNHTRLILFVSPFHAAVVDASLMNGDTLLRQFRAMQRSINQADRGVELWSFMGFSAISMEPFPPQGATRRMNNYWEVNHFTTRVGDLLLARMIGNESGAQASMADFGRRIDPKVEDWPEREIDFLKKSRDRWLRLRAEFPANFSP